MYLHKKTLRSPILAGCSLLLSFSLGAGTALAAKPAPAAAKPAKPVATAPIELELVSQLPADKQAALQAVVDHFNQQARNLRVVVRERDWLKGDAPHLMILSEDDEARLLTYPSRYKPLAQALQEARDALPNGSVPAVMAPHLLDTRGRLAALPVGLSTPVMYVNRRVFEQAGVEPSLPPTWDSLQHVLGKLVQHGVTCPYASTRTGWVHVANTSVWHNEPVASQRTLTVNGLLQVKHLARMASWYRARYLHVFDDTVDAERRFAAGECAVLSAASADAPALKAQGADIAVATLPYWEDYRGAPQNTLADGPALWVGGGKKPAEYQAIAQFVKFWLQPRQQQDWGQASGYLPLNAAGLPQLDRRQATLNEAQKVAVASLAHKPVTGSSRAEAMVYRPAVLRSVEAGLNELWADRKPAKQVLDELVSRIR